MVMAAAQTAQAAADADFATTVASSSRRDRHACHAHDCAGRFDRTIDLQPARGDGGELATA